MFKGLKYVRHLPAMAMMSLALNVVIAAPQMQQGIQIGDVSDGRAVIRAC